MAKNDTPRNRALRDEAKACEAVLEQDLDALDLKAREAADAEKQGRVGDLLKFSTNKRAELMEIVRLNIAARDEANKLRSAQDTARRRLREIRAELDCDANAGTAIAALLALREERAPKAAKAEELEQLRDELDTEIETLTENRKATVESRANEDPRARLAKIAEIDRKLETARATRTTATEMSQGATAELTAIDERIKQAEHQLRYAQFQQAQRDWRAAVETVMPAAARLLAASQNAGGLVLNCEIKPTAEAIAAARTALRAEGAPMQAVSSPTAAAA